MKCDSKKEKKEEIGHQS